MGGFFGVTSKTKLYTGSFFLVRTIIPIWEHDAVVWRFMEKTVSAVLSTISRIPPFRTKFEHDVDEMQGNMGIGCISDMEPQPLLIQSHLGSYAITTVGKINNEKELIQEAFKKGHIHFMEMSGGKINATELVGAIISQADSLVEGLKLAQEKIKGSMTILLLDPGGHLYLP